MGIEKLAEILRSREFERELRNAGHWAANLRPERPLTFLLARELARKGHSVTLEKPYPHGKKCDLFVFDKYVEIKGHFDSDFVQIEKELNSFEGNLEELFQAAQDKKLSKSWSIVPKLFEDSVIRKPDILLWIVVARNLSGVPSGKLPDYCVADQQLRYTANSQYVAGESVFAKAQKLVERIGRYRGVRLTIIEHAFDEPVPSVYWFGLCEF